MGTNLSEQNPELAQRKLALVMALDEARDSAANPAAMFSELLERLADEFESALLLLAVIHRDTGDLEMKALIDRDEIMSRAGPETIEKLADWGIKHDGIHILGGKEAFDTVGVRPVPKGMAKLQVAIAPVVMGNRARLGVMLIARVGRAFSHDEVELIDIAESQLDSAIVQGHSYSELHLRNKELETIYRVDRIRDQHLPFDEMLNKVLHELRGVIQAEMGFIMLYHRPTENLELRASTHDDLFHSTHYYKAIEDSSREALKTARLTFRNELEGDIRSLMCIPLILQDEILGVFGVVNRYGSRGFDEMDRQLLTAIGSQIDTAIFEGLEKRKLRQVLGRSVDPTVMERLLQNADTSSLLKGERAVISVLYADIRGSTALAEQTPPELLVGFINDYLGTMAEVILRHEGTLDKFVGDEVMAFFGAPHPHPDHALRAVRVGLAMQEAHTAVMDTWEKKGVRRSPIGVGIATGELIVGEMGSEQRTNYTVLGNAANLGARICGVAKAGQVVVSQATFDMVSDQVEAEPIRGLQLKGVSGDVTVYHVKRIM